MDEQPRLSPEEAPGSILRGISSGMKTIVKVQLSQFTTESTRQVLVYDEHKEHLFQFADSEGKIAKLLGDRPKAYFEVEQDGLSEFMGLLHFVKEVDPQPW